MKTKSKKSKKKTIREHVLSAAPEPRCIYCGADEDDIFVGGKKCVKRPADAEPETPQDLGAEGNNGQIEFNGSQYELTRGDIELLAVALDIVKPVAANKKHGLRLTKIFSQLAGKKRGKIAGTALRTKVNITVKSGTVQDIEFIPKIPKADITIYDYDVDGLEEERMCKDDRGKPCLITKW